jgi:diacylglycerol O-acyltransferase / wax synthase
MDRMSPLDASFLHIEEGNTHMHIGSVTIFEGPAPAYEDLLDLIARKLPAVPRYRQSVRLVPLGLGRPVWVDDPHFNLRYHVRHSALPAPGEEAQLRRMAARVMSQRLDRTKPLWELWMVEGLSESRWALITKVHHSMVDGVASTDLASALLDDERDAAHGELDPWQPAPAPTGRQLVASTLLARTLDPREQARTVLAATRTPRATLRQGAQVLKSTATMARTLRPSRGLSLTGRLGPHRRWAWGRASLADVKLIRSAHGGTVNDVVLAAVAGGLRDVLLSRGGAVGGRSVRTMVPVSVRAADAGGTYDNQVSAIFAELPIGIEDPVERLAAVRAQLDGLKESGQAVAAATLTSMSGFAPPLLLALATRLFARSPQVGFETAATNVPGPQRPVFTLGRRMLEAFPYAPPAASVRIVTSIFSYDGALTFGVAGDWDGAPDVELLAAGIERSIGELVSAAGRPAAEPVAA